MGSGVCVCGGLVITDAVKRSEGMDAGWTGGGTCLLGGVGVGGWGRAGR